MTRKSELEDIELKLLLDGLYHYYGFDFRSYAPTTLKRRIYSFMQEQKLDRISQLLDAVLHNGDVMKRLIYVLSVNVTSMFRDPEFYSSFRLRIVPFLKTYPFIRLWHAGCSTGEEVYSMAILLKEEGIYDRCRIYATDLNDVVLRKAKGGVFPLSTMQENNRNYQLAGGNDTLSAYYTTTENSVHFDSDLVRNVVFAQHNLVTDSSFNEFNVVLCRNVLIYFNRDLQNKVHKLLHESLCMFGVLCLGNRETVQFTEFEDRYKELDGSKKVYQKIA